jgi:hypothetical protein
MPDKYWMGAVPSEDDFGDEIGDEFIDGRTRMGPWGLMTPQNWVDFGIGSLGTGHGQRYKKQPDGRFLKVEG